MNFDDYQSWSSTTAVYPKAHQLPYVMAGLLGESGEIANVWKKWLRGDYTQAEMKEKLRGELGDVLWYVAQLAVALEVPLSQVAQANVTKLEARQAVGTLANTEARDEN